MKTPSITLVAAAVAFALSACNQVDNDRTTSVPRGVDRTAAVQGPTSGLSAPLAQPDRTPPADNANTAAPGTNAAEAFANRPEASAADGIPAPQRVATQAPDETIRASGAAADANSGEVKIDPEAAKAKVMTDAEAAKVMGATETARDTEANNPRHGTLTKQEEVNQLPKAGQVNNHSSTALEKDSGR